MVVALEPTALHVEQIAVRFASSSNQQFVDHDLFSTVSDHDAIVVALDFGWHMPHAEINALGEDLREPFGDVIVEAAQETVGTIHHRHLAAEGREDVAHLDSDEAATDDPETLRQVGQPHDRVGRVEPGLGQTRDWRRDRSGTRCEQYLRGGEVALRALVHIDFKQLVACETGGALEQGDVGRPSRAVLAATGRDRVDAPEHAIAKCREVNPVVLRLDVQLARTLRGQRRVGRQDEHLRRNAADVEAGAAVRPPLDDGNVPVVHVLRDRVA